MPFTLVANSDLTRFKGQLRPPAHASRLGERFSYFEPGWEYNYLHARDDGSSDLTLSNGQRSLTVKARLLVVDYEVKQTAIRRQNDQRVGVSIGDFLRCVYQTSPELTAYNDEEGSKLLTDHLKKAQHIDTTNADVRDWLAASDHGSVVLWRNMKLPGFDSRLTDNFVSFCHRMLYFIRPRYSFISTDGGLVIDARGFKQFTTALFDARMAERLLRYFLWGQDPSVNLNDEMVYVCDPPRNVPELLQQFYTENNDEAYLRAIQIVNRRVNRRLEHLLETKYHPATFTTTSQVPGEYPPFALRNVYLKQVKPSQVLNLVYNSTRDYTRDNIKHYERAKHKMLQGTNDDHLRRMVEVRHRRTYSPDWYNSRPEHSHLKAVKQERERAIADANANASDAEAELEAFLADHETYHEKLEQLHYALVDWAKHQSDPTANAVLDVAQHEFDQATCDYERWTVPWAGAE